MTRRGPNEGSLYERWDGRWAGSVSIGYEGGKRVRKHVMGRSRTEVKEKMAALMRAHEEKRPIPDQREKVGAFLRLWLDEVAKPTLRASIYDSHDTILVAHLIPGLGASRSRNSRQRTSRPSSTNDSPVACRRAGSSTSTRCSDGRWSPRSAAGR